MSRVALVAGPDLGHVLCVLGLARALAARGHATTVVSGTQRADLVAAEGHDFVALPSLGTDPDDGDFGHRLWGRAGEMAPPLRDRLAPLSPDVVVADTLTTVGMYVAAMLGVPWVEVVPHHLLDPDPLVSPIGMGLGPARTPQRRRSDAAIRTAQQADVRNGLALRDEVLTQLGVASAPPALVRLLQTLPGLEPRRMQWPEDAHVVGQLAIDLDLPPLEVPAGNDPLVVVTDSTASALPTPLGRLAVSALAGQGVRLVVTGDVHGPLPPDVVAGRGPHEPLLDRADLAIGPGGGGFVAKALTRGVPMVVVPLAGDQRETAGRVARSGAGVWLAPEEATAVRLAAAARRVLSDGTHRAAARRLARGADDLGPPHAARLVEQALAGSGRPRTAP